MLALVLFAGWLVGGCGGTPAPQGPDARLIELGKKVEVNGKPAVKEQKLAIRDVVEVFEGSFAVLKFGDGTRVNLFYDDLNKRPTRLEMSAFAKKTVTTMAFKLASGLLSAIVPPKRQGIDRYEVEGAQTVTSIEGTQVKISTGGGRDEIALHEGKVVITRKGTGQTLELRPRTRSGADERGFLPVEAYNGMSRTEERYFNTDLRIFYRWY